jgi:hypothetical protein
MRVLHRGQRDGQVLFFDFGSSRFIEAPLLRPPKDESGGMVLCQDRSSRAED